MSEWEIDYVRRNVSKLKSIRYRLKEISGQTGVPTLVDSGCNAIITGDEKNHRVPPQTLSTGFHLLKMTVVFSSAKLNWSAQTKVLPHQGLD
jgi:hypothetical protein